MKLKRISLLCLSAVLVVIMCFNFSSCDNLSPVSPIDSSTGDTSQQPTEDSSEQLSSESESESESESGSATETPSETSTTFPDKEPTVPNKRTDPAAKDTTASTSFLTNPDFDTTLQSKYGPGYDLAKWTYPIWEGTTSFAEACFVQYDQNGALMPINTLYPIKKIISVRSGDLQTKYEEGKDYNLVNGKIVPIIGEGSKMKALKWSDYMLDSADALDTKVGSTLFPAWNSGYDTNKHMAVYEIDKENGGMLQWTILVTYTHDEADVITKPESQRDAFPELNKKLNHKEAITVVSLGDSITDRWSASMNSPDSVVLKTPNYNRLLVDYMKVLYSYPLAGNKSITHTNLAVSGSSSSQYVGNGEFVSKVDEAIKAQPDLLILAFGMNDGCGAPPDVFVSNINAIMNKIQTACPDTEILVVGTCMPNEKMSFNKNGGPILNYHDDYIDALKEASKSWTKAAFADVGSVHIQMMNAGKAYNDTAGSGSNHPNDYMHRVYVQVCIQTIFGEWVEP